MRPQRTLAAPWAVALPGAGYHGHGGANSESASAPEAPVPGGMSAKNRQTCLLPDFPASNRGATTDGLGPRLTEPAIGRGDTHPRKHVPEAARHTAARTGGGLRAPLDISNRDQAAACYYVEVATPDGRKPADNKPNSGLHRCGDSAVNITGDRAKPLTPAGVGKSTADLN